jgi:microcystin-dependent protein
MFAVPYSYSGVPQTINYQGVLANANGTPVPNGNYDVEFKIYNVLSGGTALWTETWNSGTSQVTVSNGIFNVILGKYNPIPSTLFAEQSANTLYLGIKVGSTDSEMSPRQQITSVAYAFTAGTAFTAGNGIPQGVIVMWSGAINQIPEGWALCDGFNGTPNLRDRFIVGAGNSYGMGAFGGSNFINLQHSHTVNSHAHLIGHTHDYSGTTTLPDLNGPVDRNGDNYRADEHHSHTYFGTTSGPSQGASGDASPGTNNQLSTTQDIRQAYFALAFIMKL